MEFGHMFAMDRAPEEIGEIHARRSAQFLPGPCARIHIEQFVTPILLIVLEFHFHEPRVAHRGQQTPRRFLEARFVAGFDERARATEFDWVLSRAACRHGGQRAAIGAERGIRKLRFTSARDQFLHHDRIGANEFGCLRVPSGEHLSIVHWPRFIACEPVQPFLECRFEDRGKREVQF
jgi:hypothetical protein